MYGKGFDLVKTGTSASLVILAGGRGTRLGGRPKGLIQLNNSTLVERLVSETPVPLAFVNATVPEPYERFGWPVVGDVRPGFGAPGGVLTALAMATTDWVLVVGCDMPFLTRAVMEALLGHRREDVDVVCGVRGGQLEPLAGVYRRALVGDLAGRLAGPRAPSLRAWLEGESVRTRPLAVADDSVFASINTPEDVARLGERG